VIDNKAVITGSFNWSPSAAHTNDETLLVIDSPLLAKHFTREMDRMVPGAELGITQRMSRKVEKKRAKCGSGIGRDSTGLKSSARSDQQPSEKHPSLIILLIDRFSLA